MHRLAVKIIITTLTFTIGVTAVVLWLSSPAERFENDIYFPADVFTAREEGPTIAMIYSGNLAALGEPSLSAAGDAELEAYRFVWIRSFHPPVSVRIWRKGGHAQMTVKQLSDRGIPGAKGIRFLGTLTVNVTRPVSADQWDGFQRLLNESGFWSMPSEDKNPKFLDGAGWLLEGVRADRYHAVSRQSPKEGAYRETCVYLLRISGVEIDESKGELY